MAGCGRSLSRLWIVSYGMNQVLPRQRTFAAAARQRVTFDGPGRGRRSPCGRAACGRRGVKWKMNS